MFPEITAESIAALTDEELANLLDEAQRFAAELADADTLTAEQLAELERVAEGTEALRAAQADRAAAAVEAAQRAQAAIARIAPPAEPAAETPAETVEPAAAPAAAVVETSPAPAAVPEPVAAAATAVAPRRADAPPLNTLPARQAPAVIRSYEPVRPNVTLVAGAGASGTAGRQLRDMHELAEVVSDAFDRHRPLAGRGSEGSPDKVLVASILANIPEERMLRHEMSEAAITSRIEAVTAAMRSPDAAAALTAAGGLCAPVQPYYEIMVLAEAVRPVRDALTVFGADRGGIRYVPPPTSRAARVATRTVNDGATNSNTTVTSATAAFTSSDVGGTIAGTGIPAGAIIVAVGSATSVTISAAATATATGVTLTIGRPGSVGYITAAQDASALGGTAAQIVAGTKPCLHISCGNITEVLLNAISRCLEFGNFSARAYPEQVEAWTRLALSAWANRGETALLDGLSAASTQVTAAATYGAARELIGQIVKASAYYRNSNRMDPETRLRCLMPAWVIDAMVADIVHGSGYEMEFFSQARQQVIDALAEVNVNVGFYVDSGTGKGQLFNSGNAQGAGALAAFPSTAVWYLFAEGSFVFLDGGTLDLGIVRDVSTNNLNNFREFAESFEALAFVGVESLEVTSTIVASGAAAATVTPISSF